MKDKHFKTKDLGEAASLLSLRFKLIKIDQENKVVWFYFLNQSDCIQVVQDFWQHTLVVDAQDYFHSINRLKQIIYERKNHEV